MPKIPFDFRKITPEIQDSPQRQESLAPYQINQQALKTGAAGKQNLTAGVSSAVASGFSAYGKYVEAQDESDMVATRAAFLRLQKEEEQALSSTSNTMEIERITEDYDKKYDDLISGNDPAFDRPNFRNQSGKDAFKNQFANNFNLKRHLSAKDRAFAMDRRNTLAGFENGIKSIPQSNYYDQPSAETETAEYVDKQVQHGFLTEEEGVEKKRIALANLDIERASRKMLDLDSAPMEVAPGSGAINPLPNQVDGYKDYVDSLKHLDDKQKAAYKKKADSILVTAKAATKAADKEREAERKKQQYKFENDLSLQYANGETSLSKMLNTEGISESYRRSLITKWGAKVQDYKKAMEAEKKSIKDQQIIVGERKEANTLTGLALRYDKETDTDGSKAAALINQIGFNGQLASQTKTFLIGQIKDGRDLTPAQENNRKNYMTEIEDIFGMTEESFDRLEYNPWGPTGARAEEKDSIRTVDGLTRFQRQAKINTAIAEYDELIKEGKPEKAKEYIDNFMIESRKDLNTIKLNNLFFREK